MDVFIGIVIFLWILAFIMGGIVAGVNGVESNDYYYTTQEDRDYHRKIMYIAIATGLFFPLAILPLLYFATRFVIWDLKELSNRDKERALEEHREKVRKLEKELGYKESVYR